MLRRDDAQGHVHMRRRAVVAPARDAERVGAGGRHRIHGGTRAIEQRGRVATVLDQVVRDAQAGQLHLHCGGHGDDVGAVVRDLVAAVDLGVRHDNVGIGDAAWVDGERARRDGQVVVGVVVGCNEHVCVRANVLDVGIAARYGQVQVVACERE